MVGREAKQLGLKGCGGGRRRVIVLKLAWWEWDMSGQARIDVVGEGDEWLHLN